MKLLAIDIGGTFIKYGLYDTFDGTLDRIDKVKTPTTSQGALFQTIATIKQQFADVQGCAVSMPGTLDDQTGFVFQGGALQYNNNTYFADLLAEVLALPVTIENDAHCAATAELWQGKLQGVQQALVLVVGTGLGGGIIQDGKLYRGAHRYAGEFSLVFTEDIDQKGADSLLGNQVGIPNFVAQLSDIYGNELDGVEAFQLIQSGEYPDITDAFQKYIKNFARQLFNFQLMFDPEKILIGGGISQNEYYIQTLSEAVEALYERIPIKISHHPIEKCHFESQANLLGAIKVYMDKHHLFPV